MAKGYWIVSVDVSNPESYKLYIAENRNAFRKYGARIKSSSHHSLCYPQSLCPAGLRCQNSSGESITTEICPKRNRVRRSSCAAAAIFGHSWQRCVIYDRPSRCLSPSATTGRSIEYDAVTNPYRSRRSDHGVHSSARELAKIGDLLPIVANECPQNFAILG